VLEIKNYQKLIDQKTKELQELVNLRTQLQQQEQQVLQEIVKLGGQLELLEELKTQDLTKEKPKVDNDKGKKKHE